MTITATGVCRPICAVLTLASIFSASAFAQDTHASVAAMARNIYPSAETSFLAGLKVCKVDDQGCIHGPADEYDRKVNIYVGNIRAIADNDLLVHSTFVDVFFPPRQKKTILQDGLKLYLLLPTTKTSIRIPTEQTLLGDADVGSILDIDYTYYENVEELRRDGDVVTIEFADPRAPVQFPRIVLDISIATVTPVRGMFYSAAGAKMRQAIYSNVGPIGSRNTYRRVTVDSLRIRNDTLTLIDYIAETGTVVPKSFFRQSRMTSFRRQYQ